MFCCKDAVRLLADFLDGSMGKEEESALREHLAGCPPCLDFLNTYRATPGLCKKALAAKMPDELASRLTMFLRAEIKNKGRS